MKVLNYWERLKILKIQSIKRRREQFIIIYVYKILKNLVPNPGIAFKPTERNGTVAIIPLFPTTIPNSIRQKKYNSFNFIGPKLFNILPRELRDFSTTGNDIVLPFKNKLDLFLSNIPDQPTIQGISRAANSNSVIDQLNYRM